MNKKPNFFDFSAFDFKKNNVSFEMYRGQVLLVVNVASKCGFTPQYTGLEQLYKKYHARGFSVLGFPCNQFAAQEPGDETEIHKFCSLTYEVTFPLFAKIKVNGPETHPVYAFMKNEERGILGTKAIKWNFTKFLINKHGDVIGRYGPNVEPEKIETDILAALNEN